MVDMSKKVVISFLIFIVLCGCSFEKSKNSSPATDSKNKNQTQRFTNLSFADEKNGWAINRNPDPSVGITLGTVFHTKDGGNSWSDMTPAVPTSSEGDNHFSGWFFSGEWADLVVGNHIYNTENSGQSWSPTALPVSPKNSHLSFVDTKAGWLLAINQSGAGFQQSQLYKTNDGGKNWSELQADFKVSGLEPDNITFVTNDVGFVSGLNRDTKGVGLLGETTDGGNNWKSVSIPLPDNQTDSFGSADAPRFFDSQHGTVMVHVQPDEKVDFFVSKNGGETWSLIGDPQPFKQSFFIDQDTGWAIDKDSNLYITKDSGSSWDIQSKSTALTAFQFISSRLGWGITRHGVMVRTKDGGKN